VHLLFLDTNTSLTKKAQMPATSPRHAFGRGDGVIAALLLGLVAGPPCPFYPSICFGLYFFSIKMNHSKRQREESNGGREQTQTKSTAPRREVVGGAGVMRSWSSTPCPECAKAPGHRLPRVTLICYVTTVTAWGLSRRGVTWPRAQNHAMPLGAHHDLGPTRRSGL
jgi:hypothetical protein